MAGEFLRRLAESELFEFDELDKLDPAIQDMVVSALAVGMPYCDWSVIKSPIEQMMYLALQREERSCIYTRPTDGNIFITPQFPVEANGRTYHVDFLVAAIVHGVPHQVAVECDGHDFHEKTKAQAARDKRRDRDLQSTGLHVLHFTGSEIWKEPFKCATEVMQFLIQPSRAE